MLLEPIVHMEVTVPEDHMGTITGDLSGKRGRIQGTDILPGGMAVVKAQAPLAEVMQYQSQLKSVTGGQGRFAMELSHYEPVPPQVQQQIIEQYKPKVEEDYDMAESTGAGGRGHCPTPPPAYSRNRAVARTPQQRRSP